jgi:hypothetical protein
MHNVYQNATLTIMAEAFPESGSGIFLSRDSKRRRSTAHTIAIPYLGAEAGDPGRFYVREGLTPGLDSPNHSALEDGSYKGISYHLGY